MEDVKLFDIIRETAENDRKSITADAEKQADAIITSTRERCIEELKEAREAISLESARLREQKLNSVRYGMNVKRYEYKTSAAAAVWNEAESRIHVIIASDSFNSILESLVLECAADVPGDAVLQIPPGQSEHMRTFLKSNGMAFDIEENDSVRDGIEFRWPGNTVVLRNTLRERLARLKSESSDRISSMLFTRAEDDVQ